MSPDDQPAVDRYLQLTRHIMPKEARNGARNWPVRHDHCFQRIALDTLCGGVWYDHIPRPAYKHITPAQARDAVRLCTDILAGTADLWALNAQSLRWRAMARPQGRATPKAQLDMEF